MDGASLNYLLSRGLRTLSTACQAGISLKKIENRCVITQSMGIVEGGSAPLLKLIRDFWGLSSLHRTSCRLDMFLTTYLPKEKKGKGTLLSIENETFTYTGLTSTVLLYTQILAWLNVWSHISNNTAPPCYISRMRPLTQRDIKKVLVISQGRHENMMSVKRGRGVH